MAKKPGVSHHNSIALYNNKAQDIVNKKRKLINHNNRFPNNKVNVDSIMNKYMSTRKTSFNIMGVKAKIRMKKKDTDKLFANIPTLQA